MYLFMFLKDIGVSVEDPNRLLPLKLICEGLFNDVAYFVDSQAFFCLMWSLTNFESSRCRCLWPLGLARS